MARGPTSFGFRPFPRRGGVITNKFVNKLRDGDALESVRRGAEISQGSKDRFEGKMTAAIQAPNTMKFEIECEREQDGRWLAEVPQLPGVMAYGASADEAMARAEALALRVLAERIEHGETGPLSISIGVAAA